MINHYNNKNVPILVSGDHWAGPGKGIRVFSTTSLMAFWFQRAEPLFDQKGGESREKEKGKAIGGKKD